VYPAGTWIERLQIGKEDRLSAPFRVWYPQHMLKKVTLLIPLAFNDGSAIPKEKLGAIEEEIYIAFKGWTIVGEVEGAYQMQQTGAKKVERLLHIWVVLEEAELPTLKQMVAKFGASLGQEFMYFEVSDAVVEFIPPHTEETGTHEQGK
jgi:hypothetical protein